MIHNLSQTTSICHVFLNELRDKSIQQDRLRFRTNLERITHILAYELSKNLAYKSFNIETPLGTKDSVELSDPLIVASILRAGLPMHNALLDIYDRVDNCFVSAYRHHKKSGEFEIKLDYIASPDLTDKVLILADPMIATGASIRATLDQLRRFGIPKKIYILGIIGSRLGVDIVQSIDPKIDIYIGDIDEEMTAKNYIVPGLGDAGDLAFGPKIDL